MKHLLWVAGLIGLVPTWIFFTRYTSAQDVDAAGAQAGQAMTNLYIALACLAVSLVCFAIFFYKRFKEEGEQDVSITKL